ncbi:hypothetical protein [Caballeronia zhejiangensis]|uniref:hypothetical protein n=1 Tax=Caballeronia zhejiangensis TaxID=871203 RepID=UPI001588BCFE|nr:hypothetical protein [Caballeronia zhejiangensis]MCG7403011.1 hypothetical protein [Caballeronia zhejiangensis]MCI1043835.1 hypothetical protein [Caballeronia zhejiangensis]
MNDMSNRPDDAPAYFHFDNENEIVETRFMGTVTLHDVGFERVEAILFEESRADADDEAKKRMMDRVIKRLLFESMNGEHGERLDPDEPLPGRIMMDMVKLRAAIVRMYGLDQGEVKNA